MEGYAGEGWGCAASLSVERCFFLHILGGMEQRRLGIRCVVTDTRRRSTLSGVVVASAAARPGKADATVQL